jgi:hypothetical protein
MQRRPKGRVLCFPFRVPGGTHIRETVNVVQMLTRASQGMRCALFNVFAKQTSPTQNLWLISFFCGPGSFAFARMRLLASPTPYGTPARFGDSAVGNVLAAWAYGQDMR